MELFIQDPRGRANFRQWLITNGGAASTALATLDLYWDLATLEEMNQRARTVSLAVRDIYLSQSAQKAPDLPPLMRKSVLHVLRDTVGVGGFDKPSQHLLASLYANEFQVSSVSICCPESIACSEQTACAELRQAPTGSVCFRQARIFWPHVASGTGRTVR